MEQRDKERASFDYQRGRRDGYNEGFAEGVKAAQRFIEARTDITVSYWLGLNGEGISSKDQEFIDLQRREQRARAAGHNNNAYVCGDCIAEGKSMSGSTYLDWPDVIEGRTLCARHATPLSSVLSSDEAV